MRTVCGFLRFFGLLLGLFLVLGGIADATGLLPDSDVPATLAHRLRAGIPLMVVGALLLMPYAKLGRALHIACLGGLALASLALAYLSAKAIHGYALGELHWAAIPASLAILGIVAGNAFVLWHGRRAKTIRAPA
jgi:hypothetical protein